MHHERQNVRRSVAVLGAGPAGLALAADLSCRGIDDVRVHDVDPDAIARVDRSGGIRFDGILGSGLARPALVSTSLPRVLDGAELIIVSTTADRHPAVARSIAPHLRDGQVVLLHPGYVAGGLHFQQVLGSAHCDADVVVAEAMNSVHLSALAPDGSVFVKGAKRWLEVATYPNEALGRAMPTIQRYLPEAAPGRDWLQTGLNNPNPMVHVPAYLGNLGLVGRADTEALGTLFFDELVNETVQRVIRRLDEERRLVIEALGLTFLSLEEFGSLSYPDGARLLNGVPRIGPKLLPRFLSEDVPTGLVPIASLARLTEVRVPVTDALIDLASAVTDMDFRSMGRTAQAFGSPGSTWQADCSGAPGGGNDGQRAENDEGIAT